jgi:hypothetical protein
MISSILDAANRSFRQPKQPPDISAGFASGQRFPNLEDFVYLQTATHSSMVLSVSYIFGARAIRQVLDAVISRITVQVPDVVTLGARAYESLRHKSVYLPGVTRP